MSLFTIDAILNFSIVIAVVIGLFRFKVVLKLFYPFIIFVCLGFFNELLSWLLILTIKTNTVNSNIYVLAEFLILLWQFYEWNINYVRKCIVAGIIGILIWIADNLIFNSIGTNNSVFRIYYSFIIVFFSIDLLNKIILNERNNMLRNPIFLACIGFLIYYGLKVLLEMFNTFQINFNDSFYVKIWLTMSVVNCFSNLIYAIAALCIPKKQKFLLHY